MTTKKDIISLILCYVLWGFQPLYWALISQVDSYTILACRIIMAAVFSILILAVTGRLGELTALLKNRRIMRLLVPAVVFLLADWAVFIVLVNSGHILDVSLGYYINPLLLFAIGVVIFREKHTKIQFAALGIAAVGVVISTVAFGEFPLFPLIIAINWGIYAALKANIKVDGVVSIAAETLIMTPLAIAFLLLFRRSELAICGGSEYLLLIGGGIVTALPMFLYSNSVSRFSMIVMCFAQYLSPTFSLICGLIQGERFTSSQLTSFGFFILAIIVFTIGELRQHRSLARAEKTESR